MDPDPAGAKSSFLLASVVHLLEAVEGEGRLVTNVEEDYRSVWFGASQLEVEKSFVEDADVLGGQVREVHGGIHEGVPVALADSDLAAGEESQDLVYHSIAESVPGVLEGGEGSEQRIRG